MVMDDGPFPCGRSTVFVLTQSGATRVFTNKRSALSQLVDGFVDEYVEMAGSSEYLRAFRHDKEGESRADIVAATTAESTLFKHLPNACKQVVYDRYGEIVGFDGTLEEFKALWRVIVASDIQQVATTREGATERRLTTALRHAGLSLAHVTGGFEAAEELDKFFGS